VRICKWHASIVCTFNQPLLKRYVVERGGFGPMDMELWRFKRGCQRQLFGVQIWVDGRVGVYAWIRIYWVRIYWIWIYCWIRLDAWLGIYANASKPGRSCIFRRFQISNLLQGAIQLRLVW
jgi:hypothetical protein